MIWISSPFKKPYPFVFSTKVSTIQIHPPNKIWNLFSNFSVWNGPKSPNKTEMDRTRLKWIEWDKQDQMDRMDWTGTKRTELELNGLKLTEQYLYVGNSCMVIKEYRTKFMNIKILRGGQVRKNNVGRVNFFYSNKKCHLSIM